MAFERYYDSIRPYAPPEIVDRIERQRQRIEDDVRQDIEHFATQMQDYINQEAQRLKTNLEQANATVVKSLQAALVAVQAGGQAQAQALGNAVAELNKAITDYNTTYTNMGSQVAAIIVDAAKKTLL